jgi:hypothetical protein
MKTYAAPTLTVYGGVATLTRANSNTDAADTIFLPDGTLGPQDGQTDPIAGAGGTSDFGYGQCGTPGVTC